MTEKDATAPANKDGTHDKHQWENLTAQRDDALLAKEKAEADLVQAKEVHAAETNGLSAKLAETQKSHEADRETMRKTVRDWEAKAGELRAVIEERDARIRYARDASATLAEGLADPAEVRKAQLLAEKARIDAELNK